VRVLQGMPRGPYDSGGLEMVHMHCGGCDGLVLVTREQWKREISAPCTNCPDGGVDLVHARRHADLDD
jgi:hypothetical protein